MASVGLSVKIGRFQEEWLLKTVPVTKYSPGGHECGMKSQPDTA